MLFLPLGRGEAHIYRTYCRHNLFCTRTHLRHPLFFDIVYFRDLARDHINTDSTSAETTHPTNNDILTEQISSYTNFPGTRPFLLRCSTSSKLTCHRFSFEASPMMALYSTRTGAPSEITKNNKKNRRKGECFVRSPTNVWSSNKMVG